MVEDQISCPSCGERARKINEFHYICDCCGFQFDKEVGGLYAVKRPSKIKIFRERGHDHAKNVDLMTEGEKIIKWSETDERNKISWLESNPSWIKFTVACNAANIIDPLAMVKNGSLDSAMKSIFSSLKPKELSAFNAALKSLSVTDAEIGVLGKIIARTFGKA